jgi:hypothetical protein
LFQGLGNYSGDKALIPVHLDCWGLWGGNSGIRKEARKVERPQRESYGIQSQGFIILGKTCKSHLGE